MKLFYIGPPPEESGLKQLQFLRSRRGYSIEFFVCSDQKMNHAPLIQSGIKVYPVIEFGPNIIHTDNTDGNPLKGSLGW